jgi:hypothetical protein
MSMTFQDDIQSIASVALFSLLFPMAVLVGRHNVKKFRQRLLDDLERTYDRAIKSPSDESDSSLRLVSSFEMARYKYDLPVQGEKVRSAWLYDLAIYVMPCFIYIVLCTLGFMNVVFPDTSWAAKPYPLMIGLLDWNKNAAAYQIQTLNVVSVTFLGSYIWSIIYLLRSIANYDCLHSLFCVLVCSNSNGVSVGRGYPACRFCQRRKYKRQCSGKHSWHHIHRHGLPNGFLSNARPRLLG